MEDVIEKRKQPSDYERQAIKDICLWKNPKTSMFKKITRVVLWPIDKAGEVVINMPVIGWVIEKSISGLLSFANDVAKVTVRQEAIYNKYRKTGHGGISESKDIINLDLEDVDKTIGFLGAKYKAIAAAEGAAFGMLGLPGIPPDIIALVTLNMRAIGEYACYCGFNNTLQHERLFAMQILSLASSPEDAAKAPAMAQLAKIAKEAAQKITWAKLEQHAFVSTLRQIAKSFGIRITKAKLAQIVPVAGVVVGGGFNAYYTAKVCNTAYYLYRERFLMQKYGEDFCKC